MLPAGGSAQFYVEDFLGTSRVVTQNNGAVCYDGDFTPFGGELPWTNTCPAQNNYKFEGKERDTVTSNDDFGARSYSWRFGRWLSADWSAVPVPVPYANLTNPQTLNLYSMVADDPESFADLDGHQGPPSQQIDNSQPGCLTPNTCGSGSPGSIPSEQAKKDAEAQAAARNTSYTASILGQKVRVTIVGGTADAQKAIRGRLDAAFAAINQHAGDLSASDIKTIHNIKSISVDDSMRTGVDLKAGAYNLKPGYVMAEGSSTAWIASTIAHDAYHVTQFQQGEVYNRQTAPRLEHEANQFQMRVGAKFGLTPGELNYIRNDTHTLYNTKPY
jgi:RHS repeat-associated protein